MATVMVSRAVAPMAGWLFQVMVVSPQVMSATEYTLVALAVVAAWP